MSRPATSAAFDAGQAGIALLLAVVGTAGVSAVALALGVLVAIEARTSAYARERQSLEAAADGGLELALADLPGADWPGDLMDVAPTSLNGSESPALGGWGRLDIAARTGELQEALDAGSLWAADTPRFTARGHGFLDEMGLSTAGGRVYLMTWLSDDPADGDEDPTRDSNGVLEVRAEVYAAPASRIVRLATVRRRPHGMEVVSWRVAVE
jgi:hypothetical protein